MTGYLFDFINKVTEKKNENIVLKKNIFDKNQNFYICSYGGCGSTVLFNYLSHFGNVYHIHDRYPPKNYNMLEIIIPMKIYIASGLTKKKFQNQK